MVTKEKRYIIKYTTMDEDLARMAMAQMYSPEDSEYDALVREESNENYQWYAQAYWEMKEEEEQDLEDEKYAD